MRMKLFIVISAMLVFGLAIAAYSYGTAGNAAGPPSCCCCSGDSCPMKTKKDASGKETTASCCDMDCCKGGSESCPMMKKDADGKPMKMEGASCCPMMKKDGSHADMKDGEACPMMKKDGAAAAATTDAKKDMSTMHGDMKGMNHDMKGMHGEGCSCACCQNHNKEQKAKDTTGI